MSLSLISDNTRLTPEHYLAVRSDGLTFAQCALAAIGEIELLKQVDRIYGTSIVAPITPIEQMVDLACGKQDDDMQTFLRFVWNYIFLRVEILNRNENVEACKVS